MIIQGKQALADYLGYSFSMIDTNFPTVAKKALARGIQITREGKGENTIYTLTKVEPREADKSEFSQRAIEIAQDLPGEIWIEAYDLPRHEVSNLGRIRIKKNKALIKGTLTPDGYLVSELKQGQRFRIHRIILQSFQPVDNPELFTVDHINGIRTDNRLENLRWMSNEENILAMMNQRAELNKELTRIIQKLGYDQTLQLLKTL